MTLPASDQNKLLEIFRWVIDIDPATVVADVADKRERFPDYDDRELAQHFVDAHARKAGLEGFMLGLGGNPLVMLGTALGDVALLMRFYAYLTAAVGHIANPSYFDDPSWKDDALLMMAGPKAVSRVMREAGIHFGRQSSKIFLKKYLSRGVLRTLQRLILRWFGKKVTQRALLTKAVPLAGGVVGGAWNYAEVSIVGGRIMAYQFDGVVEGD